MRFIVGAEGSLFPEQYFLKNALVKGALAADDGRAKENPYRRRDFKEAWELGYEGVSKGIMHVRETDV